MIFSYWFTFYLICSTDIADLDIKDLRYALCASPRIFTRLPLPNKKSRITFSGNPAIFFKIHGFPSLLHSRFGIFLYNVFAHGAVKLSRGILLRIKWVSCYPFRAYPFITAELLKEIAGHGALDATMTALFLTGADTHCHLTIIYHHQLVKHKRTPT
jgi:hypothetical protein